MKEKIIYKSKSGITLIALVITIIVLLILAGVSINMLTGENGVLTQSSNAKTEYLMSSDKEQIDLIVLGEQTENNGKRIFKEIYDALVEDMNNKRTVLTIDTPKESDKKDQIVGTTINGYGYLIDIDTGKVTIIGDIKSKRTITYYDENEIESFTENKEFGKSITIRDYNNITDENGVLWTFVGWSKQLNAEKVEYKAGDEIVVTENISLYPQFSSETYALTIELGEGIKSVTGEGIVELKGNYMPGIQVNLEAVLQSELGFKYEFLGWESNINGLISDKLNQSITITMPAEDVELTVEASKEPVYGIIPTVLYADISDGIIKDENGNETGIPANGKVYPARVINVYDGGPDDSDGDANNGIIEISSAKVYGMEEDCATEDEEAKRMVIVKFHGDLKVTSTGSITSVVNSDGYGGPKGMFICATGNIEIESTVENGEEKKGTITMTARGAKATGEDVYLYSADGNNWDYVPAVGQTGGASVTASYNLARATGNTPSEASNRATGGGGSRRSVYE